LKIIIWEKEIKKAGTGTELNQQRGINRLK